ncbi:hypothetical protein L1987_18771 [Smallanthus sonchifolius]|uniref:Uncharacterized protein n=1 Tax=Smallanthus sonchifolius TaxID=185202 RepID=A0ACB9J0I3_9ASTR|nr:hypothetical protein L1987_18771 [Smallanthus sonchifolius]
MELGGELRDGGSLVVAGHDNVGGDEIIAVGSGMAVHLRERLEMVHDGMMSVLMAGYHRGGGGMVMAAGARMQLVRNRCLFPDFNKRFVKGWITFYKEEKKQEEVTGWPPALLGSCNDRARQLHASPTVKWARPYGVLCRGDTTP